MSAIPERNSDRAQGDMLVVRHPVIPTVTLQAVSDNQFVDKLGSEWSFQKGPACEVTNYVLRRATARKYAARK